jgi:hypothetical protein
MTAIFVAGSMNIKNLDRKVKERLAKIVESNFDVVVGDADGVDTAIQQYLLEHGAVNAVVYCSGATARNNLGDWPVRNIETKKALGSRAFFTAKDIEMAEVADYGLMIWDAKSTGTLSNVIELLCRKKKSVVFVNKEKEFKTICNYANLEDLVGCMSAHAREKADEKIGLFGKIDALKLRDAQGQMFA